MWQTIKYSAWLAAIVGLAACAPPAPTEAPTAAAAVQTAADGQDGVWGLYTYGHEVSVFLPCGDTRDFWADGAAAVMQPLEEASMRLAESRNTPYQPVLARLRIGEPVKAAEGFPAEYDAAVSVAAVTALLPTQQSCPE